MSKRIRKIPPYKTRAGLSVSSGNSIAQSSNVELITITPPSPIEGQDLPPEWFARRNMYLRTNELNETPGVILKTSDDPLSILKVKNLR